MSTILQYGEYDFLDLFKDYTNLSMALEGDTIVEMVRNDRDVQTHLSRKEIFRYGRPDAADQFLHFVTSQSSPGLLEAMISHMAKNRLQDELNMENPQVAEIVERALNPQGTATPQFAQLQGLSVPPSQPAAKPKTAEATFASNAPPVSSPSSPQPHSYPGTHATPVRTYSEPLQTTSSTVAKKEEVQSAAPSPTSERPQRPQLIKEERVLDTRVIATHTHILYPESNHCILRFNLVIQPLKGRVRSATISLNFKLPQTQNPPVIRNIYPNSSQAWSTGPSWEYTSSNTNSFNLTVGYSDYVALTGGKETTKSVSGAVSSSLRAAGIGTSEMTIIMVESKAGDGILYSLTFGVLLESQEKSFKFPAKLSVAINKPGLHLSSKKMEASLNGYDGETELKGFDEQPENKVIR